MAQWCVQNHAPSANDGFPYYGTPDPNNIKNLSNRMVRSAVSKPVTAKPKEYPAPTGVAWTSTSDSITFSCNNPPKSDKWTEGIRLAVYIEGEWLADVLVYPAMFGDPEEIYMDIGDGRGWRLYTPAATWKLFDVALGKSNGKWTITISDLAEDTDYGFEAQWAALVGSTYTSSSGIVETDVYGQRTSRVTAKTKP